MNNRSCIRPISPPAIGLVIAAAVLVVISFWGGSPAAAQTPDDDYTYVLFEGGSLGVVGADGSASGAIETPGDTDWFAAALTEGQAYRIDLEGAGTSDDALADPYIHGVYLYALELEGTRVNGGGEGLNSRIYLRAEASTEYFIVAGSAGAGTGAYTLTVTPVEQMVALQSEDDYGADTATKGEVEIDRSTTGGIETAGDTDWFRIALEQGQVYQIDVEGMDTWQGTLADPRLTGVYNAAGNRIDGMQDDDGGTGRNSRLFLHPGSTAAYYIAVEGRESRSSPGIGTYRVLVRNLPVGDELQGATIMGTVTAAGQRSEIGGAAVSGNIEQRSDVHWYAVELEANQMYQIALEGASTGRGSLSDPLLTGVHNAEGESFDDTRDDDSGEGANSRLEFRSATDARHYIALAGKGQPGTGTYRLSVLNVSASDDYGTVSDEAGSVSVSEETPWSRSGSATGHIDYSADVDWFRAQLEAGQSYRIHLDGKGAYRGDGLTLSDPLLAGIYDADGGQLPTTTDDDSGYGRNSRLLFTPESDGAYYIAAASFKGAMGKYRLMVIKSGDSDDYSADSETSGIVEAGGKIRYPSHGVIERPGDRDWFAVKFQAGRLYNIEVDPESSQPTAMGPLGSLGFRGLYDQNGVRVSEAGILFGVTQFSISSEGTYYVVAGGVGDAIGSYRVVVTDLVRIEDDMGDDPDNAGPLFKVGSSRDAWIEEAGDVDWFPVQMTVGRTYNFRIEGRQPNPVVWDGRRFGGRILGVHGPDGEKLDEGGHYRIVEEFSPPASGVYYFAVTTAQFTGGVFTNGVADSYIPFPIGEGRPGTYRAHLQDVTDDDPGDALEDAIELPMNDSRFGSIDRLGDRDRFRVELEAGHTYIIDQIGDLYLRDVIYTDASLPHPYIRGIYDANGVRFPGTSNDERPGTTSSRVEFTADEDGAHYIAVSHGSDYWYGGGYYELGTYRLLIRDVTDVDDYGDDTETNGELKFGQWKHGTAEKGADRDWFAVDLSVGTKYQVLLQGVCSVPYRGNCQDAGTLAAPMLHGVHDADGAKLPDSDASSGSGREQSTLKVFTVPSTGRYYVNVGGVRAGLTISTSYDFYFSRAGTTGTYRVKIENLGANDQTEDVNTTGRVEIGGYVRGSIDYLGDRDWFAVDLQAGHLYEFDMIGGEEGYHNSKGNLEYHRLRGVYDSDGNPVPGSDGPGWYGGFYFEEDADSTPDVGSFYVWTGDSDTPSRITFIPETGGRYYVSASAYFEHLDTGTYTFYASDRNAPDDYRSDIQTEGRVCDSVKGRLERKNDQDWFAVDLEGGVTYQIDLVSDDGADGLFDPYLRGIYDADSRRIEGTTNDNRIPIASQPIGGPINADSRVVFTPEESGRYYIAAGHAAWSQEARRYTLSVTPEGNCDAAHEGPDFGASTASRSVPENSPAGTAVGEPIAATDPDGGTLTYSLEGTDAASFAIDASTGQLSTVAGVAYDYETKSSFEVTVRAENGEGLSDTITVTVTLTNVPEPGDNNPAVGAPAITGTARVGETLTADVSGISDADGMTNAVFSYQWLSSRDTEIEAANAYTYTLHQADLGKFIRVTVSFTDDAGNTETLTSAATNAVEARPNSPATGVPTISGTAQVGETLTADASGISDADGMTNAVFSYQWTADRADITGATGSTYTLSDADEGKAISVRVSFTDDAVNAETLTSAAQLVAENDDYTMDRIWDLGSWGEVEVGGSATAVIEKAGDRDFIVVNFLKGRTYRINVAGYGDDALANVRMHGVFRFLYAEELECSGAFGDPAVTTYVLTAGFSDVYAVSVGAEGNGTGGYRVSVYESADTATGCDTEPAPSNTAATGLPTISGMPQVGETLTADASGISDSDGLTNAVFSYQWTADGADITGATGSTHTLSDAEEGKSISVTVSFTDDAVNAETLTSAATAAVAARPNTPATGAPTISGTAQVAEKLTADTSGIADEDGLENVSYSYRWQADGVDISGATDTTYTLTFAEVDKTITVMVSFTDDWGHEETLTSSATAAVQARPNTPATGLPTISGTVQVAETLTADVSGIADEDGLENVAYSYQWQADGADIYGAIGSSYTLVHADESKTISVTVSFTDDVGNSETLTSKATNPVSAKSQQQEGEATDRPHDVSAAESDGAVVLTWEKPVREGYSFDYRIMRHRPELGEAEPLVYVAYTSTKDTIFTDRDVEAGVLYVYRVQAVVNFFGDVGDASDPVEVRVSELASNPQPVENSPATGQPAISGTAQVGGTLTADTSGISDADGLSNASFSYRWQADDSDIAGATDSSYTLVDSDEGTAISVSVSFTDDAGNAESLTSAATDAVEPKPNSPATGLPTISGTAQVGETLTADTSGIADEDGLTNATFSHQWQGDGSDIPGATGSTYTLADADEGKVVSVTVNFTDDAGNAESLTSVATGTVAAKPNSPATGLPTIGGTAQVGETLTADTSGIADEDGLSNASFSYQWISNDGSNDADIAGATGSTYTLAEADQGKAIKVKVSFTDDAGNEESLTSNATAAVAAKPNTPATGLPTIAGTAQVGETLTAGTSGIKDEDGLVNASFSYQWRADDSDIPGATGPSYTLADADEGKAISVSVSFTDDAANEESLTSEETTQVAARPNTPATGAPTISGTAQVGGMLTADTSGIADEDGLSNASFSYQWQADGADISGATGSSYTLTETEEGKAIRVAVSFIDDAGNAESLTSAATDAVAGPPPEPLTAVIENAASSHDGESAFTFELRFSEGFSVSYKTLRDHAFEVTGGDVKKAKRLEQGSNVGWRITVRPNSNTHVTIVLPVTADCGALGAICTGDGRMLSNRLELTVSGPGG